MRKGIIKLNSMMVVLIVIVVIGIIVMSGAKFPAGNLFEGQSNVNGIDSKVVVGALVTCQGKDATIIDKQTNGVIVQYADGGTTFFAYSDACTLKPQVTACSGIWSCSGWNTCVNNLQQRTCEISNGCMNPININDKPAEEQSCVAPTVVVPVVEAQVNNTGCWFNCNPPVTTEQPTAMNHPTEWYCGYPVIQQIFEWINGINC